MLASHALALVGVPMRRVIRITRDARDARYGLLRGYFHGADDDTVDELQQARLLSVTLPLAGALRRADAGAISAARDRRAGGVGASRRGPGACRRTTTCCSAAATRWCCRACPRRWRWPRPSCSARLSALRTIVAPCLTRAEPLHSLRRTSRATIRTVPDWPAPGVQFRDITPLLSNPRVLPGADRPVRAPLLRPRAQRGRRPGCARLHHRLGAGLRTQRRLRADPQEGQAALHDGGGDLRTRVRRRPRSRCTPTRSAGRPRAC